MIDKSIQIEKKNGSNLYVNILEKSPEAPNVIYIMTPMGDVNKFKECYSPLVKYGCNVFALSFSGIGKSEGLMEDFSMDSVTDDIDTLVRYIIENYSEDLHMFGATGMGGIIAQAYLGKSSEITDRIKSFAQTGVAIHGDMSIMPNSRIYKVLNIIIPFISKAFPRFTIKFKVPKFNGVNAEKEMEWYLKFQEENPRALDMHIAFVQTLLGLFFNSKSPIRNKVSCPTLVIIPEHDRYYNPSYVNRYYESLDNPKKIYTMDDSHLVFTWNSQEICREVGKWVDSYSKEQTSINECRVSPYDASCSY
ncbi:alpha/beta hydrolase [Alkalicella caledoniensis]|uniref:Alpha/beta hydrolase n=1 Tax=Alkalicella caledoniensis TaxID=2731377 RepID=A0A7G9W9H5_ALKCA|nr:alpha/beta hydrolase [Alkalicella caledoniensis]QNO15337.1 alpha/beta hydrolase [Alkalicella caledoniensis]